MVVQDEWSGAVGFYPTASRKIAGVEQSIRDFAGKKLSEIEQLYSDNAPEFKALKRILKLPARNSTPRRPNSNARLGRTTAATDCTGDPSPW